MVDLKVKAAKGVTHFVADCAQDIKGHDFIKNLCLNICDSVDKTIEEQQVAKNIKKTFEKVMPEKVETIRRPEQPALTVEDVDQQMLEDDGLEQITETGIQEEEPIPRKRSGF